MVVDPASLYILDKLPAERWQGRLLAEAGRLAKADINSMIRATGRWPTSADLRAALEPPPAAPEPSGRRWKAVGIANEIGHISARMAAWIDREAGAFADALAEWRAAMAEWGRWQAWRQVATEAARLTTAIREYVGDSRYLGMIGFDYDDVCRQAEADVDLATRVLAAMRGWTSRDAEGAVTDPTEEDMDYVMSWGLDLAASLEPTPAIEVRWSSVYLDPNGRWRHRGGRQWQDEAGVSLSLVEQGDDGRWRHVGGVTEEIAPNDAYADRLIDRRWHRRRLNKVVGQTCEHVALVLRLVGAHGSERCCTNVALERRRSQVRRQLEWGKAMEAAAPYEGGQRVLMAALMAASRKGMLASMWCVIQGMAEHAREAGMVPMWITLTAPGKFHAAAKSDKAKDNWEPHLTPADAKDWMQGEWAKARAWLAEEGVEPFGVWVAEPNEDGCYHRHVLLWVKPEQRKKLRKTIRRYWKTKAAAEIDQKADDATSSVARYIWSYLRPALMHTGHGWDEGGSDDMQADHRASDEIKGRKGESAERYDTHASTWGYRRFGFFGLEKGTRTAWNKIYRWPADMDLPEGPFAEAKAAMDRQDWKGALRALGAFGERRFAFAYTEAVNRYGESTKVCRGVSDGRLSIRMSCGWTIEPAAEANVDNAGSECFVDEAEYGWGVPDVWAESYHASFEAVPNKLTLVGNIPRGGPDGPPRDPPGGAEAQVRARLRAAMASTPTPVIAI